MKTTVTELPDSRARVEVEVEPPDVEARMHGAAKQLGRELRIPGFRKGKVPPQVVLQRVGRAAVVEQALRDSLPEWYVRALEESGVAAIGQPELDVSELPEEPGEPLRFSIEVAVRPPAKLGKYRGLEVPRAEPEVPEEAIRSELDRLREGFASLNPVEREARDGDHVLIDYRGTVGGEPFEGSDGRDELVELGGERLLGEMDAGLRGARPGEERTIAVAFPSEGHAGELASKTATFEVTVKEVREKDMPALDDEFAAEASEFDTLAELREDIAAKLREVLEHHAEEAFRAAAVDAAAEQAKVDLPEQLVEARADEMWHRMEHSLAERGVSAETYLKVTGRTREQVVADARPEAERALRREAALEAIADAEGIEGADDVERMMKAAELVVEHAKPIPPAQAEARERLWTPDKEHEATDEAAPEPTTAARKGRRLWTPGRGRQ